MSKQPSREVVICNVDGVVYETRNRITCPVCGSPYRREDRVKLAVVA